MLSLLFSADVININGWNGGRGNESGLRCQIDTEPAEVCLTDFGCTVIRFPLFVSASFLCPVPGTYESGVSMRVYLLWVVSVWIMLIIQ
jgi:hypothetical protein